LFGRWEPRLGYGFERYDYQDNPNFNYLKNEVTGGLDFWMTRQVALEAGAEGQWYTDEEGGIVNDQTYTGGLRLRAGRYRARTGYGYRRDHYGRTREKSGFSHMGYAELSRWFLEKQMAYAYYRYRMNNAQSDIYSYEANLYQVGLVNPWTRRLKFYWTASYMDKRYQAVDARFGVQREEDTIFLRVKPTFSFYEYLRVFTHFTWTVNDSTADRKDYVAQVYGAGLELRF
jgi:hypothetical protein